MANYYLVGDMRAIIDCIRFIIISFIYEKTVCDVKAETHSGLRAIKYQT